MKIASPRCSLPHQTGVTERSIGDNDGDAADRIVQNVVIGHLHDGISARFQTDRDGHHHFLVGEVGIRRRNEAGGLDGIEHPFEIVLAHHEGRRRA